jgi:hypothetical protein
MLGSVVADQMPSNLSVVSAARVGTTQTAKPASTAMINGFIATSSSVCDYSSVSD